VDGKTPVYMVSAFACKNRLLLGQIATEAKSNEITAIPKLLAMPMVFVATGWWRAHTGRWT